MVTIYRSAVVKHFVMCRARESIRGPSILGTLTVLVDDRITTSVFPLKACFVSAKGELDNLACPISTVGFESWSSHREFGPGLELPTSVVPAPRTWN